jgi:hypothetical protein
LNSIAKDIVRNAMPAARENLFRLIFDPSLDSP